jgi:hypothetical protein
MFNFIFLAGASSERQARLSTIPTMDDIGRTFAADPVTVAMFDDVLTDSPGTVGITSHFGVSGLFREAIAQEFFTGELMGEIPPVHSPDNPAFILKAFVPQLGPNFFGYRITGVDQTINGMLADEINPLTVNYWGAQTIRIFGERIPEPATAMLVIMSMGIIFTWPRTTKGSLIRQADVPSRMN